MPFSKLIWITISFLVLLQFLPLLILQDQAYIRIHDTLEGEWFWNYLLQDLNTTFGSTTDVQLEQLMNGVDRRVLPSGLSIPFLLAKLFGLYYGYLINYFIIHTTAFLGMALLLRKVFLSNEDQLYIVLGVSAIFSWVPVFTTFGLTVAGLPLLMYSLIVVLRNSAQWYHYVYILAFPFYSSLVWGAPPIMLLVGALLIYYRYQKGRWNQQVLWIWIGLLLAYVLSNYTLFSLYLQPGDFVSHRAEYSYFYNKELSFLFSISQSLQVFFIGHYHSATMISLFIFLAFLYAGLVIGWTRQILWLLTTIVGIVLFFGFYNWLVFAWGDQLSLLKTFKFERFHIVLPFLWLLLFGLVLGHLHRKLGQVKIIFFLIAAQLLITIITNDEFQHNVRQLIGLSKKPNFEAFYDTALFAEIDAYIDQPKSSYRIAHLGIHPAVSLYNGFYTLDGHLSIYDLNYKYQFEKIIRQELIKDEVLIAEFYNWGNRCYLYSAELGKEGMSFTIGKQEGEVIHDFEINTAALCDMGGEYIFSAVAIKNAPSIGLQLQKVFERPDSYWRIYLYKTCNNE